MSPATEYEVIVSSRRKLKLLSLAVGLLAIGLIGWTFTRQPGVAIGNDWWMEFVAASVDRMEYKSESAGLSRMKAAMPMSLRLPLKMQLPVSMIVGDDGVLFLAFVLYSPAHLKPTPESLPRPRLEILDELGNFTQTGVEGYSQSGNARKHGLLYRFSKFPRRQPTLHFRLTSEDGQQVFMEKTIPNPGYESTFPK